MFKCTSFLENISFLGMTNNGVPLLYGNLVDAEPACCVMDLERGTFEKRASYDHKNCLVQNIGNRVYIHDLKGKQELLVVDALDVKTYAPLEPNCQVTPLLGGQILFEDRKQDIRKLVSLDSREQLQSFPMSAEYRKVLKSSDPERLFFLNENKSLITCVQGFTGDVLWQTPLPEHVTVNTRRPMRQYNDVVLLNGEALLTEPVKVGSIEFDPRGSSEKVKAVIALDATNGNILWVQAPAFGGEGGSFNASYNLDASMKQVVILWTRGCHCIDLKTGETIYLTIFDNKAAEKQNINFSSVYENYVLGAGKKGDLIIFDTDKKEIVQKDKGRWRESLMDAPVVSKDFLLIYEDSFSSDYRPSVSIFSRS